MYLADKTGSYRMPPDSVEPHHHWQMLRARRSRDELPESPKQRLRNRRSMVSSFAITLFKPKELKANRFRRNCWRASHPWTWLLNRNWTLLHGCRTPPGMLSPANPGKYNFYLPKFSTPNEIQNRARMYMCHSPHFSTKLFSWQKAGYSTIFNLDSEKDISPANPRLQKSLV